MKRFLYIIIGVVAIACSPDTFSDCIGKEGKRVNKTYELDAFTALHVHEGIQVKLIQDSLNFLDVEAGEHIISAFEFFANADTLYLKNNLTCSLGYTKPIQVNLHFKDLSYLFSNSQFKIYSENVLQFNRLEIFQGLYGNNASGDFDLQLQAQRLLLNFNTNSYFKLSGRINDFAIYNWGGGTRVEAADLICNNIEVLHRGYNHFYLHATDEINGNIYGVGNIYLGGNPPIKNVTTHYTGRMIE